MDERLKCLGYNPKTFSEIFGGFKTKQRKNLEITHKIGYIYKKREHENHPKSKTFSKWRWIDMRFCA